MALIFKIFLFRTGRDHISFYRFGGISSWLLFPTQRQALGKTLHSNFPSSHPQHPAGCTESRPLQQRLLPAGVSGKLIPDSHLIHTELINSNSLAFIGWRVPAVRAALPETTAGQLCLLLLQMHSKEKQHPRAVTRERWFNLSASSSAACCSPLPLESVLFKKQSKPEKIRRERRLKSKGPARAGRCAASAALENVCPCF